MKSEKKYALLLLSGGMDSTACLDFLISNSFKVTCLLINYGQLAAKYERAAAKKITKYYGVELKELNLSKINSKKAGYIQGRNFFLYSVALVKTEFKKGIISSGIHKGTSYPDCTPLFNEKVQEIYDIYTEGRIRAFSPFAEWDKKDIWDYCQNRKVPLNLTYSCERGQKKQCGKCLSCKDMKHLYAGENK
jgi:7-cyano-7-deazaguanine synthase